ncbi:MAG: sugar ABC transporter permease [Candidatus Omnitrophica bacterium]|nr:sugar ABC transporter permease [Candidatus Omnitrophota bacterium]
MKGIKLSATAKETLGGYAFLLPNFLGFLVFTSIPVIVSFGLAFYQWDLLTPAHFVGLENFVKLIQDKEFWYYCYNTVFLMLAIPVSIFASLGLAVMLNKSIRGIVFYRTIYFLPTISSGVAIFVLWRWIYNTDIGLLNTIIRQFGDLIHVNLQGVPWLTNEKWAKPALVIMGIWQTVGGPNMILYLAALQGVPRALYEAADIDGANGWQKFWHITWPMISPTTFFIMIMSIIGGFQSGFDAAYIMTGGGPNHATTTIMFYIYENAFSWHYMGYAAAISWVLFIIILIFTLLNWRAGGKRVHY